MYINTLYSNSNVVGVFIVNGRTVVSLTGSHPPPSLAAHRSCTRAHGFVCNSLAARLVAVKSSVVLGGVVEVVSSNPTVGHKYFSVFTGIVGYAGVNREIRYKG